MKGINIYIYIYTCFPLKGILLAADLGRAGGMRTGKKKRKGEEEEQGRKIQGSNGGGRQKR